MLYSINNRQDIVRINFFILIILFFFIVIILKKRDIKEKRDISDVAIGALSESSLMSLIVS